MGAFSIWHILILLGVVMLLFGAGKRHVVSDFLGDIGLGFRRLKEGVREDEPGE